ncbi:hypothetical protein MBLNU459_g7466t1 [Dothideomycetes sp. NU459]
MQHHQGAPRQPDNRLSFTDDDDDDQPLSFYAKRGREQYESRPLIERVTNRWQHDEKSAYGTKQGYTSNGFDDDDDDDDEHELTHCCDLDSPASCPNVTSGILRSRRFRRVMLVIITVVLLCYYGWKWYLRPGWEREAVLLDGFNHVNGTFGTQMKDKFDDLVQVQELAPEYRPGGELDPEGKRRLVFVGDIHGCNAELLRLLEKVNFDTRTDHLIAVGDVVAKGPDSPGVIDTLISLNASSVRGNHEDRILVSAKSRRKENTEEANEEDEKEEDEEVETVEEEEEEEEEEDNDDNDDSPDASASGKKSKNKKKNKKNKGAGLKGPALLPYLKNRHLAYLRSLPLIIHIPALTPPPTPAPPTTTEEDDLDTEEDLVTQRKPSRKPAQSKTIATDINVVHGGLVPSVPLRRQDPFSVMHMRSMSPSTHVPSERRDRGLPWERIWGWYNERAARRRPVKAFSWFDDDYEDGAAPADDEARVRPVAAGWLGRHLFGAARGAGVLRREEPSVVVYGHDSPRGLNLRRWSKGLDSGCVNGNRLSAMVLDAWGQTQIVSVGCKNE